MENSNQTNKPTYGKIQSGFIIREHVGTGKSSGGNEFELSVAPNMSPLVYYKGRFYILSWQDIVNMAADAGLFDDTNESKEAGNGKGDVS